jgi:tRNA A37 threonylcarbamoyladenosine dehydratase
VTHGYRLQDSILPAVTYTVDTREDASVGGETQISQVTVTSIAETSEDALAVAAKVRTALVRGTYNSIEFDAVMVTADGLQPEVVGLSDEQEPSQAVTQATIYWRP